MLKKLFSIAALTSLLVGGLSVSQANADATNVLPANVVGGGAYFTVDLPDDAYEVEVPAGLKRFDLRKSFYFQSEFLSTIPNQTLTLSVDAQLPNGSPLPNSDNMMDMPTGPTYFPDINGNANGNMGGQSAMWNYEMQQLVLPADTSSHSGSINARYYIEAAPGQTLPAGTYLFNVELNVSSTGIVSGTEPGLEVGALNFRYLNAQTNFVVPVGTTEVQLQAQLCVDSAKVAVGDVISAAIIFDGQIADGQGNNFWSTRSSFRSNLGENGLRPRWGMGSETTTVTEYDIQWGLGVSLNSGQGNLAVGSSHDMAFKLYNQDNEDVSGNCAPPKPVAPTLALANGTLGASGSYGFGSTGNYESQCVIYDSTAPNVALKTVTPSYNFQNQTSYSCSFSSLTAGKTYLVKFRDGYNGIYSEFSDASSILIPAPGYTITSTYAGVAEAKKIVKVSDNVLPVEDYGIGVQTAADGNGGFYMLGQKQGACPPTCATVELRLRKASATALDTSFAGTGSVIISSFTPRSAYPNLMGFYGSNKDKWAVPVNGFNNASSVAQSQIFLGSTTSATVTSQIINASDVNTICDAASAGYTGSTGGNMGIGVISASNNDVLLSIGCTKQNVIGISQFNSSLPVLVTMNATTGALALKAVLGTPSAQVNNVSARFTVNTAATGTEPMVTAFVTSSLVDQVNMSPTPNGGTITDRTVVRLDSSLNVLSTTPAAWGTPGGTIPNEPSLTVLGLNTGKIFAITRFGTAHKVLTLGATGVASEIAIDTTASEIATPTVSVLAGSPTPSDETVMPVTLSAFGKDAAGWVNLTTGVLTSGEVLTSTYTSGNGVTKFWLRGTDKNSYLVLTTTVAPANMTVLKWMDIRTVAPVANTPTVTSKDVKYSKNTPTAGAKVTLTGTKLNFVTSAKIGANAATLGTKTATSLQLTIPTASAAGSVDITLTTADGDTVVDTFTYVGTGVAQSVTVGALAASVTVGDADLTLSATVAFSPVDAGTAGAITWSSETPTVCSIVANKARLLTAGTCTVKATAAASGVLLAGSGTQSTAVSAAPAGAQTVTLTGPTKVVVDLDGFDVASSASSGLPVVYSTTTPAVCTVTSAGRVVAIAEGTCEITSSQAGNASWLAATKSLSITVAKTPSTPVTEKGDIKKPLALSKTGTFLKNGDAQLGWNRSKGTLAVKLSVVYVGPVKASISFKVGSKTYTCTSSFGILKKQSSSKLQTITSPNLCSGKTEKTQLAALKKITTSTVVTVTIVRDMYLPTTYKKIRTKTRILYAKLG